MDRLELVSSSIHRDENGSLFVFEAMSLPFAAVRIFLVNADEGQLRGEHAHRRGSQMLVAVNGKIQVRTFDGANSRDFLLENIGQGLVIPPLHWAEQRYLENSSTLLVLCDSEFDELDYIRDFREFEHLTSESRA